MTGTVRMGRALAVVALLTCLGVALAPRPVSAQRAEDIKPRIEQVQALLPGALAEADATTAQGLLDQARGDAEAARNAREEAARLRAEAESTLAQLGAAPARRARDTRPELAQWQAVLPDEEPVESAEARLQGERSALDAARASLSRINTELSELLSRPRALVDELGEARARAEELRDRHEATLAPAEGQAGALSQARAIAAEAALARAEAQVDLLQARQETLPARQRLLESRRRDAEREVMLGQQRLDLLAERVERFRLQAAQARQEDLLVEQQRLAEDQPRLQGEVDTNLALIEQLESLERQLNRRRQAAESTAREALATQDVLRNTRSRLALGSTDEALGLVLLAERRRLADPRRLQRELDETRRDLGNTRLLTLDLNDRLIQLDDIDGALARLEDPLGDEDDAATGQEELSTALEEILDVRAQLLPQMLETTRQLVEALAEHERSLQEQLAVTLELETLLDRRLLWIPSHAPVNAAWLARHPAGWHDLFKPSRFPTTTRLLRRAWPDQWHVATLSLLLIALVPLVRRRLPLLLAHWRQPLRHVSTDGYHYTLKCLAAALLAAAPVALAVYGFSWMLQHVGEAGRYSDSLGRALGAVTPTLYAAGVLYWISHPDGLAAGHLRWTEARVRALRLARRWILLAVVPLQFIISLAFVRNLDPALDTAGRDAMLALCAITAWLAWRLLAPGGIWVTSEGGSHHRLRRLARVAIPAAVSVVAILILGGFLLSGGLLLHNLWATALLVFAVGTLYSLIARWLLLGERRLAMRRYLERKAAEAEAEAGDSQETEAAGPTTESGEPLPDIEPDEVTLQSVSNQTRRLLRALVVTLFGLGLLWVWAGLLPALGRLDEVVLWQVAAVDSAGTGILEAISLKAVLLGMLALALTFIAARNLPGLVEIGLLSSEAVDAPTRYAITSVCRYLIVIVGVMIGVSLLGLRWSQLQWMAAALTVGLGFGLQEIFANFISGLILLFERPFRVGDVITVGELTGTVTKIRTRATTLRDFDNKEIVVPNKTFITGQLINWTLSDTRTRMTIKVGVAYGTPPQKVHELLRQAASEHPLVATDPAPATWFMTFGDSALQFELRVFVNSFADRLVALNEINMRVAELFATNGIEIAFPQMDLHVRDLPPRRRRESTGDRQEPRTGQDGQPDPA